MRDESLSALLDGECSPEELNRLLDDLDRSPELRARYSRMCLSREVARGLRCGRRDLDLDLSGRVMAALDAEPAPAARVLGFPGRIRAWQPLAGLAGLALAASMAAVAVVGWVRLQDETVPAAPAVAVAVPAAPVVAAANPSVAGFQPVAQKQAEEQYGSEAELRQQLDRYLIEHNTHSPMGMARYAAHHAIYRPDERR
ncbi:MAG: sigma-E factor negative regulatory protein [Gammaproteobacteria bacterium]|nr:sigma-E factor negative regulatory protein [Gammaproteobacteria bacterium]